MDVGRSVQHDGLDQADIHAETSATRVGKQQKLVPYKSADIPEKKVADSQKSAELLEEDNNLSGFQTAHDSSGFLSAQESFSDAKTHSEGEEEVSSIVTSCQRSAHFPEGLLEDEDVEDSNEGAVHPPRHSILSVGDHDDENADVQAAWPVGEGFSLPPDVAAALGLHQKAGIKWLWKLHLEEKGGILGDDMGPGKPVLVATYLAELLSCGIVERALLVVPATLLELWELKFASVGAGSCAAFSSSIPQGKRASFLSDFNDKGGIMLTTYGMIKDLKGSQVKWNYLVLDEAQLAKNPNARRFIILKALQFRHCILLTGALFQNQVEELWALYDLCCEGLLGTYEEFKREYETPIVLGIEEDADAALKQKANDAFLALMQKIRPYFLRRTRHDISLHKVMPGISPPSPVKTDLAVWFQLANRQNRGVPGTCCSIEDLELHFKTEHRQRLVVKLPLDSLFHTFLLGCREGPPLQEYVESIPGSPRIPRDRNPMGFIQGLLEQPPSSTSTTKTRHRRAGVPQDFSFEFRLSSLALANEQFLRQLKGHYKHWRGRRREEATGGRESQAGTPRKDGRHSQIGDRSMSMDPKVS